MRPFGAASLEESMSAARAQAGQSFVEMVIALFIMAILTAVAIPNLQEARRDAALSSVARRVRGLMYQSRARALQRGLAVALVFERRGSAGWQCFVAEDRDGDGVLREDLDSGRDVVVSKVLELDRRSAGPGILAGVRVPDPSNHGWLEGDLNDPIRAGRGNIITFSALGTATPSSVYLTDGCRGMRVLRVFGATGRVNSLRWKKGWARWRQAF
jgi:type II secretory pathway pseudopilin PulG